MNQDDKKDIMEEFEKGDGEKRLELWDYACKQQVVWEKIITEMQNISREQNVDKQLEKMIDEELKKMETE
ncbi:MAG: hypothetical protein KAS76_04100 [Thermoplasmatales archaeon]|nr:hypothetical protein [Thermoplasmatales archaeon]MCK5636797.1 hypothetical protein [Thermoplasmatales archaeon]